ncbi:hypothetical protein [Micromonospora fluostatini]|uniref:hypothetical protein n=1 Tax=Micromonospora sp. JCM 30529 TaxID=3421643 RepID=UPI003D176955
MTSIRPGDVFLLTRAASVQFARPITVRVIRHHADWPTYHGWTWIDCYQLDARGDAVARRELYVMPAGMTRQHPPPPRPTAPPSAQPAPSARPTAQPSARPTARPRSGRGGAGAGPASSTGRDAVRAEP